MEGIIAYALSKKYTQKSLDGLGALKGAPCVIKETKIVDGGTEVTFEWTGISGATETQTILVKNGEDGEQGNGVAKVEKIKSVDLVDTYRMTFTDGSAFDYEVANGDSSLGGKINIIRVNGVELPVVDKTVDIEIPEYIYIGNTEPTDENIVLWINPDETGGTGGGNYSGTSGIDIGGIKKNQVFNNATMQEMFDMLLHPYEKPTMTLGINPTKTIYNKVEETLTSITINANVTKKTENIKEVRFYVDNVLVNTDTAHPNGGLVSYTYTFASPTNTTFNVKIECEDIKGATSRVSANTNVYFVGKSYYGVVEDDGSPFAITESLIKGLSKTEVKIKKALTYKNINATFGRIVYAYPKNLPSGGALTSIKDQGTGWSVFDSYTSQEITIDSITYLCYYMIDAGGFDGVTMVFA